ncbi:MAG: FAD-dependent oxidoreductase [Blastocatellia bacterium]|nr:FAD-dependent oxidoreductase [Blastocatellia bacterium]
MANIVVLGGGFAGVVAAESLARRLGPEHRITLVSRHREFTFFPSLVRLAFGRIKLEDVFFDLVRAMRSQRVVLMQAEVASYDPDKRYVVIPRGRVEQRLAYDYLVFALGRRLATERVPGFFKHAHHLLTVGAALKFGEAIKGFHGGHAVIGCCEDARLAVPVYETAFALDRLLRARGERDRARITVVSPDNFGELLGGDAIAPVLREALVERGVEFASDFSVNRVTEKEVWAGAGQRMDYDLLMLIPPFQGPNEAWRIGCADPNGYIRVDNRMRVHLAERMYAAGDSVNYPGPKMGHMAVSQGEVAAANLVAEIEGREPEASYDHELMFVIDEGGEDSIYLHHKLWDAQVPDLRQGRFWGWAKRAHARYWARLHALKPVE